MGIHVPNTRRGTLRKLKAPLGPWLTRRSELTKVVSTYGTTFLKYAGEDNRIHPSFEQIGASTGRMACHSPNLQAIPKDSEHRNCFHTGPGRRLVVADYATCELRILAEMSGDPVFREAFARGDDLHSTVASSLFNQPVSKTQNSDLRHRAKAVNFGLVYGMGAGGLGKSLGVGPDQARELLDNTFVPSRKLGTFSKSSKGITSTEATPKPSRGVNSIWIMMLMTPAPGLKPNESQRTCRSKGTSADITKLALALIWKKTFYSRSLHRKYGS